MFQLKEKFALRSVRNKIVVAFLFGCLVIAFSWVIARLVFKETFMTLSEISKPNPKLILANKLFQRIHRLDQVQKLQLLKFPDKTYTAFQDESRHLVGLLDSLKTYCKNDTFQLGRIAGMQRIMSERDDLLRDYLNFRNSISLSKDMHRLSDYLSQNMKKPDSAAVKSTTKKTITTTLSEVEDQKKTTDKKESFFKRLFKKKGEKAETVMPLKKLVTEDVQVTIDTFAITQRDSFIKDMRVAVATIERKQTAKGSRLLDHELKLTAASNIFLDELQQLLHQIQQEEILHLQNNTSFLNTVFKVAFNRIGLILIVFFVLALTLIFLMFSDISQSNKNRLQLIEAKERAEHLEQVKHRFLANMSHEIRTPLQSILGYAEQVKTQEKPERSALEAIYRSSEHLLQIVNEVLDYSRIISGKFVFEKRGFDLAELLAEVSDTMEGQAEKKELRFKFKSDIPGKSAYLGDPFRLKQILYNLLGNAIKFTVRGEINFQITAGHSDSKKTEFIFEIRDTGIGMTEQEIRRVFNAFEQAGSDIQRQYGGTGLGLSITKTLVEMQGGSIEIKSNKGQGSAFTVKLSYLKSRLQDPETVSLGDSSPLVYQGKAIVVDDDEFILQLCSTILTKNKIAHTCYSSPEQALEAAIERGITHVLLDMRMPKISGSDLYQHLKRKLSPSVKFIALTAQALPEEKSAILAQGFDFVVLKPFREKDLMQPFSNTVLATDQATGEFADRFDLSSIKALCMNDEDLFKQNIALLLKQTDKDTTLLKDGLAQADLAGISEASHRLAAQMGQLGLMALSRELHALERSARDPAFRPGEKNQLRLIERIEEARKQLRDIS